MNTAKSVGRMIGALLLVQATVGFLMNFVLLAPAIAPPGFLTNAAANAVQVNLAALLLLVSGALWVAMAITALPAFRQYSHAMALWFLALAVISFSSLVAESIAVRSLLSLSQEYAKAGAADVALFQGLGVLARSVRNSAHYTNLLVGGGSLLVLYSLLFRFALVPRALSAFGLFTVVLMITGALIPLFGYRTVMLMFMPMGLSHLALALWLLAKGFAERHRPFRAETLGAEPPQRASASHGAGR